MEEFMQKRNDNEEKRGEEEGVQVESKIEKVPAKNVRDSVAEVLKDKYGIERTPPPIEIEIFYSGHERPGDLAGFEGIAEGADILLPELAGWQERNRNTFNKIASPPEGKKPLEPPSPELGETFETELQKVLYERAKEGKKVAVTYVDVPDSDKLADEIESTRDSYTGFFNKLYNKEEEFPTFDRAILELRSLTKNWHDSSVSKREEYILDQFGPRIAETIVKNPSLLDKDKIRVVMMFGASHGEFYDKLKERNPENTLRDYTEGVEGPIVTDYRSEIGKKLEKDEPIPRHLYARSIMQTILERENPELFGNPDTTIELVKNMRGIIDQFSADEIGEIYSHIRDESFSKYLDEVLDKKGIKKVVY